MKTSAARHEQYNKNPTLSSTVTYMVRNMMDFVCKAVVGIFILFGIMVMVSRPLTVA